MFDALFKWPKDAAQAAAKVTFFDFLSALASLVLLSRLSTTAEGILLSGLVPGGLTASMVVTVPLIVAYLVALTFSHFEIQRWVVWKLGMKAHYERARILEPLLQELALKDKDWERLDKDREGLLRLVFHRYIDEPGSVSEHLKWRSYDLWAWRYIALGNALMGMVLVCVVAWSDLEGGMFLSAWPAMVMGYFFLSELRCAKISERQVQEILQSPKRREVIHAEVRARLGLGKSATRKSSRRLRLVA